MNTREANLTRRPWILAALMLSMMLAAMDVTIVATAVPQIVADLGGFSLFTWVFSIYLLTQTVTIPIYAKLADIHGRKPVLIGGSLIFLIGSAACAAAWNMPALILFRAIQGLGAGSIMATVNTLAGDLYTVRERSRIQGFLSGVWGMAAIIGPTLGGGLAEYVSWRWIFLINLPIGAAAIALLALFLRENIARTQHRLDIAGAGSVLLAVGTLIVGLLQGGRAWPWLSPGSLLIFGAAAILVVLTVWIERRASEPIIPGWLWRHRELAFGNAAMVGIGFVLMGPTAYLPVFVQSVYGLGAIAAGLVLATMSIGWPTASALSGKVYLRIGFRDTALIGAGVLCVASAGFLVLPYSAPIWAVVADQVALGVGFGLLSTAILVGMQSSVAWQERGVVTGANVFSRYLGQSLGAACFGAIFNASLLGRLDHAPPAVAAAVPNTLNRVVDTLNDPSLPGTAARFLRHAIAIAVQHIYMGLVVVTVMTFALVLIVPRDFARRE